MLNTEINVSYTHISERLIEASKRIISPRAYYSSGSRVLRTYPGSSGCKVGSNPRQDALPCQGAPMRPLLRLGQCTHLIHPMCTSSGCGDKPESQRKPTQTQGERANSTHGGPGQLGIDFFLYQHFREHYMRTCWLFYKGLHQKLLQFKA